MSFIAKLYIEEHIINLEWYQYAVLQSTNPDGLPSARPVTQVLKIAINTLKKDPFFEKMMSGNMIDKLKIVISPIRMDGKSTKLEFLDVNMLVHKENFDGVNSAPMMTYIELSYASLVVNEQVIDVKYWHKTDPRVKVAKATTTKAKKKIENQTKFD